MKFCSECGSANLEHRIPEGDNRPRHICSDCGAIYYSNPKIVAGTLPIWEDKILFCRRAIEPRHGFWTLPAGYMENGESVEEAAIRETLEEADARVTIRDLYAVYTIPHISQVYMIYLADLQDLNFGPGTESLEVELRAVDEIPWDDLAFRVIDRTLKNYCEDLKRGSFGLHRGVIEIPWPKP